MGRRRASEKNKVFQGKTLGFEKTTFNCCGFARGSESASRNNPFEDSL